MSRKHIDHDALVERGSGQAVGAREVDELDGAVREFDRARLSGDRDAWIVAHPLLQASEQVEERGFPDVGIPDKGDAGRFARSFGGTVGAASFGRKNETVQNQPRLSRECRAGLALFRI